MKQNWLRWTLPPSVSLLVHAGLIGTLAYIGMQISAADPKPSALPMAELALPAPPEPQISKPHLPKPQSKPQPRPSAAAGVDPSQSLEQAASKLANTVRSAPTMNPIALAALESSNTQTSKPESTAPPRVAFAGVQTQAARKIVYVVDGSGATANSFAYLQAQLQRSIDRLSPTQRFQVILFRSFDDQLTNAAPINQGRLARATRDNKQVVGDWLSTIASRGRSNPLDGLRQALSLDPDLILLITRSIQRTEMGWAQGQRAILQELNTLNPLNPISGKRPTVIKAIQLLDEDPTGIMLAIGTFHGDGVDDYKVVTYDNLVAPDEPQDLNTRSIGATNEQRIASASEFMNTLAVSGINYWLFYGYTDESQQQQARDASNRIRSLTRALVEIDGRAALLDAQALLMLQLLEPGPGRSKELASIIDTLDGVMYTDPSTDAQRVITLAQARIQLNQPEQAIGPLLELIEHADELGIDQTTRAQALLAMISLGAFDEHPQLGPMLADQPFETPDGSIDLIWGVVAREAITKARLTKNQPDPFGPMLMLRRAAQGNEPMLGYIDARITLALESTDARAHIESLPMGVLLAAANTMSRSIDQREQALRLLEEITTRHNEPNQIAEAYWRIGVLGHAINTRESRTRSASALAELAMRYPEHPKAGDAIAGAIHATPNHQGNLRKERLALAVRQFPDHPQIDLWRLELAEMLADFEALDVLDPIAPDTREGVLAGELYEQIVTSMMDRYTDPQVRRGLGLRMRDASARFGTKGESMWTKQAVLNEIEHDPESAISSIDQLIAQAKQQSQPTQELELLRAQTLNRLGQTRTAFEALSALSAQIDSTGNHTSTYWQAWTLMLEMIAQEGSERDRADAARHIARLELIDSNLGGSPWSQRIIAVRQMLHSSP